MTPERLPIQTPNHYKLIPMHILIVLCLDIETLCNKRWVLVLKIRRETRAPFLTFLNKYKKCGFEILFFLELLEIKLRNFTACCHTN